MKDIVRQIGTLVAIVAGIILNSSSFRGGSLGRSDVGQISDQNNTLITPASGTFAIWGLIFTWTLLFAIYQALPSQRANPLFRRIGWWPALNGIGGGLWTLAFTSQQFILAWVLIVIMLVALLAVSIQIGLGRNTPRGRDYWLAYVPFNINFGWLTIATIVNTVQVLQYVFGWDGTPFNPQIWAVLLIVIAASIGVWQVLWLDNIPFGLVVVWALSGIAIAKIGIAAVLIAALVAAALVAMALLVELTRHYRQRSLLSARR